MILLLIFLGLAIMMHGIYGNHSLGKGLLIGYCGIAIMVTPIVVVAVCK